MLLDGLVEMADDMVADIAVDHSARTRDVDFLYRAVVDRAVRLRLDTASRDIRIADAVRARKENCFAGPQDDGTARKAGAVR